jgi:exo-1,4-beta-D-glucosaminidase
MLLINRPPEAMLWGMAHETTRADGRATAASIASWRVRSSSDAGTDGGLVSRQSYRAKGWYEAPPRSTVMAALLANGLYPGIEYSTNMRDLVDAAEFKVPWWFRTTFSAPGEGATLVQADGVIPSADLWVNGAQVASREVIAGAYTTNCFDVSQLVTAGTNVVAFLVHPGDPNTDLSIGWVDWNQWPPDNNMGIWRDVWIKRTGDVSLDHLRVTSELTEDLAEARLAVTVDATNRSPSPVRTVVAVTVTGPACHGTLRHEVELLGGQTERVSFDSRLQQPAVWWPAGEGDQALYSAEAWAAVDGMPSDRAETRFGVRTVTSHVADGGGRWFVVNGRPMAVRGGGWSPDLFLRHDRQRIADEIAMAAYIGLNTIRLEGKGENAEFFDIADEMGMMVLPGWECCDKWESHAGTGGSPWDDHDFDVAARSMSGEAYRLGNHPSVLGFIIGSDFAPEPRAAALYVEALSAARWDTPIVSSATSQGCEAAGPSGMKMTGPYAWVPPSYWSRTDPELGGAVGFNSEASAGNNIPRLASLRRMLSESELDQLWREPAAKQFHAGAPSPFDNIEIFHKALSARYGPPRSLADFVAKSQLSSYEAVRAQFEAFGARTGAQQPATGVVYWMLNSAWPSLNWQLWDNYLDAAAAYFATRKAHEPLHIQYDYSDGSVVVVNRFRQAQTELAATATVRDLTGAIVTTESQTIDSLGAGETTTALKVSVPETVGPTYFLELQLLRAGKTASRNVYWLSSVPDVLALEDTTWQYTPARSFADLRGLEGLPAPAVDADLVTTTAPDGATTLELTLSNPASTNPPALGVHASLVGHDGGLVSPVWWDENDVVLFGGEALTIRCSFTAGLLAPLATGQAAVEVDAFGLHEPLRLVVKLS